MLPHHHASSQDPPTDQTSKPLLEAAEKGRADEVKLWLNDCGADIEAKDSVSGGGCYGAGLNAYLGGRGPILFTKPLNPYYLGGGGQPDH